MNQLFVYKYSHQVPHTSSVLLRLQIVRRSTDSTGNSIRGTAAKAKAAAVTLRQTVQQETQCQ